MKTAIGGITQTSNGGESIIFGKEKWGNNDFGGRTPKNGVYSGSRDCCKGNFSKPFFCSDFCN